MMDLSRGRVQEGTRGLCDRRVRQIDQVPTAVACGDSMSEHWEYVLGLLLVLPL